MNEAWLSLKSGTDIRGDAIAREGHPAVLTSDVAQAIGVAFVLFLREQGVSTPRPVIAVGRDSRLSGPELSAALMEGLTASGCRVLDCGLCTTPAMFMTTVTPGFECDGAIMTTASHHPYYRNGFKFFTKNGGLVGSDISWMLEHAQMPQGEVEPAEKTDFLSVYASQLAKMVKDGLNTQSDKPLSGLHVVVDAGNGAGGFYADLLKSLGADTRGSQFLEPDGRFPNHIPNPEDKDAMAAICSAVRASGADLGVIFDTDCDRAALVDGDGNEINRDRLIALISAILLSETPGITVVTDSVTSTGLRAFIEAKGGTHHRYKRGYRNVIDEAIRLNAQGINCPLAIETSGHAALKENYFLDDGMYLVTRILITAMQMKAEGKQLGELLDGLVESVEQSEIRLSITAPDFRAAGEAVIAAFEKAVSGNERLSVADDNREGMRIVFKDMGWVLARLSVHDPVIPINAQADVTGGVRQMLAVFYDAVKDCEGIDFAPLLRAME